jgi:hypothetical protein
MIWIQDNNGDWAPYTLGSGGGVSIPEVKTDPDISDAINKKHYNTLDHSNAPDHNHVNKTILDLIQEALTIGLKGSYDGAVSHAESIHAPANAQRNSDITKSEIEAKLTGEISSHTHAGGGGGLSQQQVEGMI